MHFSKMGKNKLINFIFLLFLAKVVVVVSAWCPSMCTCDSDQQNRKRVICENGGVSIPGSFSIKDLDPETVVLIVGGPLENPNIFTNLNNSMFQDKKFIEIHLTNSLSEPTGNRLFQPVASTLEVLNLTHNKIKTLTDNNFRDLNRLKQLYLANNVIQDISSNMGSGSPELQILDLSNNPIVGELPESLLANFPKLQVLKLANVGLNSLSSVLRIFKNDIELEELDLSKNHFSTIVQNQWTSLKNLKRLNLAENFQIEFIGNGAFSGTNLDNLDLSGLREDLLKEGIFDGARIRNLDLSKSKMKIFDKNIFSKIASDLTGLKMNENENLEINEGMFSSFTSLKELSMTNMKLNTLSQNLFDQAGNSLEILDLSESEITGLSDAFFMPLINLAHLNLAGNKLSSVPSSLKNLPKLETVDLSNNKIKSFPKSVIDAFASPSSNLKSLRLNDNPWNCDCGVASLSHWLTDQGVSAYEKICVGNGNFTCPVCEEPFQLKNTAINSLPENIRSLENCAPEEETNTAVDESKPMTSVISAALLVALLAHNVPAVNVH